ncbi:MAG: PAS domain-containing protein, partial [Proteobacteria bacterium]|nr:PAS domain-containing protein [Pseudomonadota bacterium]
MVKTEKKKPLDFGPEAGLTPSREGADNFQRIINDTMVDGLVVIDEKGIVLSINKACTDIFGYSEKEVVGNNVNMLMNRRDKKHHDGYLSKYLKTGKAKIIGLGPKEVTGRRKDGSAVALELVINSHKEEGGETIFVGSLRDITKRKEAEAAIEELQKTLKLVADNTPDVITLRGADGKLLYISPSAERELKYKKEDFIGTLNWQDIIHPDDREGYLSLWKQRVLVEGKPLTAEMRMRNGEGIYHWYESNSRPVKNDAGEVEHVVTVARNITERKEVEAENLWLVNIVEDSLNEIYVLSPKTLKFNYVNKQARKNLGYSMEELKNMTPADLGASRSLKEIKEIFYSLENKQEEKIRFEGRHKRKDGSVYDIELNAWLSEAGKGPVYVVIIDDITEKKAAEAAVKEAEERLKLVTENMSDIICMFDKGGKMLFISPSVKRQLGWTEDERLGGNCQDIFHPDDKAGWGELQKGVFEEGKPIRMKVRYLHQDGSYPWFEAMVEPIRDEKGKITAAVMASRNITEQRKAEDQYKMLADHGTDIVILEDTNSRVIYASPSLKRHLGIDPEKAVGEISWDMVHPEDRKEVRSYWDRVVLKEKKPCTTRLRFQHEDSRYIWFENLCTPVVNEAGKVTAVISACRNISEQHEAEEKLKLVTENMSDMIFLFDTTGKILFVSPSIKNQLGWTIGERLGKTCLDILHAEDKPLWSEWKRGVMEKGNPFTSRVRYRHKDGSYCWFESITQPIKDEKGRVTAAVMASRNVTEQHEAEEKLKMLAENTSDIITLRDSSGKVIYITPSFKKHLGYDPGKERGKNPRLEIIHPDDRGKLELWEKRVYREGKSFQTDLRLKSAKGEYLWFESHTEPIKDKKGNVIAAVTTSRNITEQHEAEEKLKMLADNGSDIIMLHGKKGEMTYI